MAILLEEAIWEEGIYQYEQDDFVEGGPDGIDNIQGQQLANRTLYLKKEIEKLAAKELTVANQEHLGGVLSSILGGYGSITPEGYIKLNGWEAVLSILESIKQRLEELEEIAGNGGLEPPPPQPKPVVSAGINIDVIPPATTATLAGTASSPEGFIVGVLWELVDGPNTPTIANPQAASTQVTGLVEGAYVFKLTAFDNLGLQSSDEVNVTVYAEITVSAGSDVTIIEPANTVILSGSASSPNGDIVSWAWTRLSGVGTVSSPSSQTTDITGITTIGSSVFRLTVTDSVGVTGYADVTVELEALFIRSTPTAQSQARSFSAATTVGDHALFGGGMSSGPTPSAVVDAYDTSLTRSTPTPLSVTRGYLAATTVGDHALFGGGVSQIGNTSNTNTATVNAYDTSLTRSTPTALSQARNAPAATTVGDHALFGGGDAGTSVAAVRAVVDAYDTSLTRSTATSLSVARADLTATTVGGYALFGGGYTQSAAASAVVDAYDTSLTRLTPTALSQTMHYIDATTVGGYALFGGYYGINAYDTSLTRSTPTALSQARNYPAATTVSDHALFGGGSANSAASAVVDAYDTSLTRLTPTPLSVARNTLVATTVGGYALFSGSTSSKGNVVDAYKVNT